MDKPIQAVVPLQAYLTLDAVKDTFSGTLTDEEARRLLRRTITLTQEEVMGIDAVVQSPQTDYVYFSEFVRSAVVQLLMAYAMSGFPDKSMSETIRALQDSRRHAARLTLRGQFQDNFATIEQAIQDWTALGDWEAIDRELEYLDGLVKDTQELSTTWAFRMENIITKSAAVRNAVNGMKDSWGRSRRKALKERADRWVTWLEALT